MDFQGQSQKTFSGSEFKFRSGISGNVPPGLCQIKQLQSETKDYGVVFCSNCNPHTNNKSLVTLTYLDLDQTQHSGLLADDEFTSSFASFYKYDALNPMVDKKSLRSLRGLSPLEKGSPSTLAASLIACLALIVANVTI